MQKGIQYDSQAHFFHISALLNPVVWLFCLKAEALERAFYFPLDSAGTSPERRRDRAAAVTQPYLHLHQRFIQF